MFILFSLLFSVLFVILDLSFFKVFQLENYKPISYIKKVAKFQFAFGTKTPLKATKRIKRLIFCDFLVKFLCFSLIFAFFKIWLCVLFSFILFLISDYFVLLSFLLMMPIERLIKNNYIKKAQKKLSTVGCKIIAITGSFGKTSTKNILYQILSEQFKVCVSPNSFNTPMGVCKTILENLKESDEFLILEFGARKKGDIEKLAKMFRPDFSIITPIGACHLETFKSIQTIENTKFELCENTKNFVVFNDGAKKLYERFNGEKYLAGGSGFCFVKDVSYNKDGSKFNLVVKEKNLNFKSVLLSNFDNIAVAVCMAHLFGESFDNIKRGVCRLKPTPHRMELIKGFANVIDDSYNSNFDGFLSALKVLSHFSGKKIVVSPGIVELGNMQYEINFKIAKEVKKYADVFMIMNKTNKVALSHGAEGMEMYFASTREEQTKLLKSILNAGDVVLFENDLPDNFA